MTLKVCDRCGCEITHQTNDPHAIKFGWTDLKGEFTNKTTVAPFDLCNLCMKQLAVFLGCEPKRIGMKEPISYPEKEHIKKEIDETLERVKNEQEKYAK